MIAQLNLRIFAALFLSLALAGCGGGDGLKTSGVIVNSSGNQTAGSGAYSQPQLPTSEIMIETVQNFIFAPDVGDRSDKVIGRFEFALRDVTNNRYVRSLDSSNMIFQERRFGSDEPFVEEVEATQSSGIEVRKIDVMYLIDSSFSVVQAGAGDTLIEQANKLANEINARNSDGGPEESTTRYRTFADSVRELQITDSSNPFSAIQFEARGGGTALYQGISQALTDLSSEDQPVLFVFTDGRENASLPGYDLNSILDAAVQYGIPIYIAGLGNVDSDILNNIAATSGGQFFQADTVDQLSSVFERILYSIPAEYSVSYRPTQRSGHVEFKFVVNYGGVSDEVMGSFNVSDILAD